MFQLLKETRICQCVQYKTGWYQSFTVWKTPEEHGLSNIYVQEKNSHGICCIEHMTCPNVCSKRKC